VTTLITAAKETRLNIKVLDLVNCNNFIKCSELQCNCLLEVKIPCYHSDLSTFYYINGVFELDSSQTLLNDQHQKLGVCATSSGCTLSDDHFPSKETLF